MRIQLAATALTIATLGAVAATARQVVDARASAAAPPLLLAAERIVPGNPPLRTFVTMREDGSGEQRIGGALRPGTTPLGFAVSRDGRQLFAGVTESYANSRVTNIYSLRLDGSARHHIGTAGSGAIALSPDAMLIAYVRSPSKAGYSAQLWAMRSDGSQRRELVRGDARFLDFPGSWAPSGDRLAFTRCRPPRFYGAHDFEDRCAVYVVGADGSGLTKVADSALEPDWSPDGTQIAFVSMRDHTGLITADEDTDRYAGELYTMDADGGHQRRVTTTPGLDEALPRWSPGGTRIGFVRRGQPFTTRLFQINADGTCTTAISRRHGDTSYDLPTWIAAGRAPERPLTCG